MSPELDQGREGVDGPRNGAAPGPRTAQEDHPSCRAWSSSSVPENKCHEAQK